MYVYYCNMAVELINKMSEILIVLSYYMKNGGQSLSLVMILCDS